MSALLSARSLSMSKLPEAAAWCTARLPEGLSWLMGFPSVSALAPWKGMIVVLVVLE